MLPTADEVGLIFFVYRNAFFSSDAMNVLDLIVVAIDRVGMIGSHVGSNILSFTVLRTLRLIRVARILRGFAELRKLYVMLRGLVSAFRAIAFVTGLIFSMLLMWSILACRYCTLNIWICHIVVNTEIAGMCAS